MRTTLQWACAGLHDLSKDSRRIGGRAFQEHRFSNKLGRHAAPDWLTPWKDAFRWKSATEPVASSSTPVALGRLVSGNPRNEQFILSHGVGAPGAVRPLTRTVAMAVAAVRGFHNFTSTFPASSLPAPCTSHHSGGRGGHLAIIPGPLQASTDPRNPRNELAASWCARQRHPRLLARVPVAKTTTSTLVRYRSEAGAVSTSNDHRNKHQRADQRTAPAGSNRTIVPSRFADAVKRRVTRRQATGGTGASSEKIGARFFCARHDSLGECSTQVAPSRRCASKKPAPWTAFSRRIRSGPVKRLGIATHRPGRSSPLGICPVAESVVDVVSIEERISV